MKVARLVGALAVVVLGCGGGEEGGGRPEVGVAGATGTLWVRLVAENEVGRGLIAYANFFQGNDEGTRLELAEGDQVSCNGRRLEKVIDARTLLPYYKVVVPDMGASPSYSFVVTRAGGDAYQQSISLPDEVIIDAEATDAEVRVGRDATVSVSEGTADELEVTLVAPCLALQPVVVAGDARQVTVSGDRIECACVSGGLVPPCEGVVRAQRFNRGAVDEAFAGGEILGAQRHEIPTSVLPE